MTENYDELALYYHEQLSDEIRTYLRSRGISDEVIDEQQLGWGGWRITIPIRNRAGDVTFFKLAKAPQDQGDGPKMLTTPGTSVELYGWDRVNPGTESLIVCEGEFDRLVLESRGYAAVTSTGGPLMFRRDWAAALQTVPRVYVCFDRDAAGAGGAARVARLLPKARIVTLPPQVGIGGDVTDFFVRLGRTASDFNRLLAAARPMPPHSRSSSRADGGVIPARELDELRSRLQLETIAGKYVDLAPKGRALVGRCPFHDSGEASLVIYPEAQRFLCSACGARGDVIAFFMKASGLGFREAVEALRRTAA